MNLLRQLWNLRLKGVVLGFLWELFFNHLRFLEGCLRDPRLVSPSEAIMRSLSPLDAASSMRSMQRRRYERAFFVSLSASLLRLLRKSFLRFRIPLKKAIFDAFESRWLRSFCFYLSINWLFRFLLLDHGSWEGLLAVMAALFIRLECAFASFFLISLE